MEREFDRSCVASLPSSHIVDAEVLPRDTTIRCCGAISPNNCIVRPSVRVRHAAPRSHHVEPQMGSAAQQIKRCLMASAWRSCCSGRFWPRRDQDANLTRTVGLKAGRSLEGRLGVHFDERIGEVRVMRRGKRGGDVGKVCHLPGVGVLSGGDFAASKSPEEEGGQPNIR